ncbi:hypothetical protein N824_16135 [Pedobacter sp. V48]|nr:hypothetical protein N824_16135 [Pedobacter sp. V48]
MEIDLIVAPSPVLSEIFRTHQFLEDLKVVAEIKKYINDKRSTPLRFRKP